MPSDGIIKSNNLDGFEAYASQGGMKRMVKATKIYRTLFDNEKYNDE